MSPSPDTPPSLRAPSYDDVGKATVFPSPDTPPSLRPLPSFPEYPQNPNFVIPRAVAESISPCQRISQRIQRPLRPTMDTATSRSMTALVRRRCPHLPTRPRHSAPPRMTALVRRRCSRLPTRPRPSAPSRHSRSTRRTQTSSFRAQSRNPSRPAKVAARESSALCAPPWILGLRAV